MEMPKVMRANGNILPGRFVSLDASDNNSVLQAAAGARTFGISHPGGREAPIPSLATVYAAQTGDDCSLFTLGMTCLLELGAACLAGNRLKSDTNGKGVPISGGSGVMEHYGAEALEAGSAGDFVKVLVVMGTQTTPAGGSSSSG